MKRNKFESEEQLAEIIVDWLKENGWEVYQEVQIRSYDSIADIVAIKDEKIWVIETKLNFGFKVLAQADGWKKLAHYISIGIPYNCTNPFREKIAKLLDIGVLAVTYRERYNHTLKKTINHEIIESVKPTAYENPYMYLKKGLNEHQKTFAKAGNNGGQRYTPFKNTIRLLQELVAQEKRILLKDAITKIKHHYSSDASARNSLRKWILDGQVKNIRLDYEKNKAYLYSNENN